MLANPSASSLRLGLQSGTRLKTSVLIVLLRGVIESEHMVQVDNRAIMQLLGYSLQFIIIYLLCWFKCWPGRWDIARAINMSRIRYCKHSIAAFTNSGPVKRGKFYMISINFTKWNLIHTIYSSAKHWRLAELNSRAQMGRPGRFMLAKWYRVHLIGLEHFLPTAIPFDEIYLCFLIEMHYDTYRWCPPPTHTV